MKIHSLTLVAAVICALPTFVLAADTTAQNPAYLMAASGGVVTDASSACWRTGEWTPALATAPCDGMLAPVAVAVAPAPAPVMAQPEPMAAAAPMAPAPVLVPVPVPVPVVQKISFSGDALFGFDKSVLRPESRTLLDGLVAQLAGTTSDTITVTGNTDRIGSAAYNQKLSEQRALAVKDYLVSNNIQATSIVARGVGETQPATAPADCKGDKASAKLVACLQPDRRVDVEMSGTRTALAK